MVRIALAQLAPTVGDITGNAALVTNGIEQALSVGADLVAFPELMITGYPPEDLLLKRDFIEANLRALSEVAARVSGITAVVGFVDPGERKPYNAAAVISDGRVQGMYHKHLLPNYGVFDERRYFESGGGLLLIALGDETIGVTICEDLWSVDGPHAGCAGAGASCVVNINASPYHMNKGAERMELLKTRALENGIAFAYVNMVGGQDELVFDGQSAAVDSRGELVARAAQFSEEMLVFDLPTGRAPGGASGTEAVKWIKAVPSTGSKPQLEPRIASVLEPEGEAYGALVAGVRDYVRKNGFNEVIVGISGGIDSALTAAVAVDALGAAAVTGISNPSEFTSRRSMDDAEALARNLGFALLVLPIDDAFQAVLKTLDPVFEGMDTDVTEENVQARLRGMIWMAISNKMGRLVLSTGNKSEMAVGYATLYGDMAGGFAVLKDVPKTLVYRLARWRNKVGEVIPQSIIERPPTAELRHDQLDTDSLPPYEVLDPILEAYVEDDRSLHEIVAMGFDRDTVARVMGMVDRAEYKRRQSPPGIKITDRAFGKDRRLPITNRYRPYR